MRNQYLQTDSGRFCILELDHPLLIAQQLGCDFSQPDCQANVNQLCQDLMEVISPDASGVILSPESSYYAITKKAQRTGVIFSLEKQSADHDPLSPPPLIEGWSIEETKNNYGVAKFSLEFHPQEEQAVKKLQLVSELYDYAHHEGIDLWLELIPLHLENLPHDPSQILLESVNLFKAVTDCLVVAPTDALTSVTITADLDTPWVLADRSRSYDQFKETFRAALESGARGFIAGNVLWQDQADRKTISTTVRDRFLELTRITIEAKS